MTNSGPPPGYWQASDGNWYPPSDTTATPTPTSPPRRSRWKLWAGIGAGVFLVLIIIGLASPKKKGTPTAVTVATSAPPTSARPVTTATTRPATTTTTEPPTTTTTEPPTTTTEPPTTAPPTTVSARAALFTWYTTLGQPVITQVGAATDAITAAAKALDVSALKTACQQLTTASQRALDLPAPPNASMAGHFSAAMSAYHSAGQDCYRGAIQIDAAAIGQATSEITDGNSEIALATADVKAVNSGG